MTGEFSLGRVFTFAGAIVACLIGSGFASGQEAMQYITAFGLEGAVGAALLTLLIYVWFSASIMSAGYKLQLKSPSKIFEYYCGKKLGKFYEAYTAFFLFLVFMVMISGAGATLNEYFGLNPQVGRIAMAVMTFITVMMGLKNLLSIVSRVGPAVIFFAMIICIINICMNFSGIVHADEIMKSIIVTKAAPAWYVSGIIYPAMGCIILASFLAGLGGKTKSSREAKCSGFLGGLIFSAAAGVMGFGLMASIGILYLKNVPALVIAQGIYPEIGIVFAILLFSGIYTTAVSMLWLSCNAIIANEKSRKFKILVFVFTIIAFIGGQFPFAKLVNTLYPITGYLGILLLGCIFVKQITGFQFKKVGKECRIQSKPSLSTK
jgi:uncharacterized membrane protein YkvI